MSIKPGRVILDLNGPEIDPEEKEILQHPLVGGVILFTRNYENPPQITALCKTIRKIKNAPILITVDHEGGKVQRFQAGFTPIPAMGEIGEIYDKNPQKAVEFAEQCGSQMAGELLAVGVDLSFAPVLDLNKGLNPVTDRGRPFHREPKTVVHLAKSFIKGMKKAGMAATGKHFPGHGAVTADTHLEMPTDDRELSTVMEDDLIPFIELIHDIDAIMPAHIIFNKIDNHPAGFSKYWLQDILRAQLKFTGMIFSDDLNMGGANIGNYSARAKAAMHAGCDMILICNNRGGAIEILDHLIPPQLFSLEKFNRLRGKNL